MRVQASTDAVLAGRPVAATPCDPAPVSLSPGSHHVELAAPSVAAPVTLTLSDPGTSLAMGRPSTGTQSVRSWASTSRRVRVDTSAAAVLVVRENFNAGWQASVNGHRLTAVQVDGWQQAFVVPAGVHGVVVLTYAPQRPFTVGLIIGSFAATGVLALLFVRARRPGPRAVGEARLGRWIRFGGLAVAVGLLGGGYGLGVLAAALVALALLGRTARGAPAWIGAGMLVVAALAVARTGTYQVFTVANGAMTQLLCLASLTFSAVGGSTGRRRQGRVP